MDLASLKKPRRKKLHLSVKLLLPLSLLLLFLSFQKGKEDHFIEVAALEVVHAEAEVDAATKEELKKASDELKKKEKVLDDLIVQAREKEKLLGDLVKEVKERGLDLDSREKELEAKADNLRTVKKDINERLERLQDLKKEVEKEIDKQRKVNEANILKLAKVYESTPPQQAGSLLSTIDVDIAAQILLKMNNRKAGKIWGFVETKKAAMISKKLAQYNSRKKK